jgi:hypothetical protein
LARRVLSAPRASLLLVLALAGCRREQHAPAPSPSVSATADDFTERARQRHFQDELTRASARWQTKPTIADCAIALKEKADLELCHAAERALSTLTGEPATTGDVALARLAPSALAFARLSERLRYLSLAELAQRHLERDAGVAPSTAASAAVARATAAAAHTHEQPLAGHAEQRALQLSEGPVAEQLMRAKRLERDVIRNLGAYLEYGPLPVRRAAFDTVKRLHAEHPRWPALGHLLSEATVLEADADLKRDLQQLSSNGSRRPLDDRQEPDQSAETK